MGNQKCFCIAIESFAKKLNAYWSHWKRPKAVDSFHQLLKAFRSHRKLLEAITAKFLVKIRQTFKSYIYDAANKFIVYSIKGTVAWVFSENNSFWCHQRFPRAIFNLIDFARSYSSFKIICFLSVHCFFQTSTNCYSIKSSNQSKNSVNILFTRQIVLVQVLKIFLNSFFWSTPWWPRHRGVVFQTWNSLRKLSKNPKWL